MSKGTKEKWLQDAIGRKWISVISLTAFLGIGIWMILVPEGLAHQSIEKTSVYLMKEIWSYETGLIIIGIAVIFLALTIIKIRTLSGFVWVKVEGGGHYLCQKLIRIPGLESLYDADDLIVFNPNQNEVYKFENYAKTKPNKYRKVKFDDRFNALGSYWSADSEGYYLFDKGVRVKDLTSEYRGDDLIVTANSQGKRFRLSNYKKNANNRIHEASKF